MNDHVPSTEPSTVVVVDGRSRRRAHPLDWALLLTAVLALASSFARFYTYDVKGVARNVCGQRGLPGAFDRLCDGDSTNAWHGIFGWLAVVLALAGAVLVAVDRFAPRVALPVPARVGAVGAYALATVSSLIALAVVPDWPPAMALHASSHDYDSSVSNGHGIGFWLMLAAIVVGLVLAVTARRRLD